MTGLKALLLNCSLKKTSEETSHTEALGREVLDILENEGVHTETVRLADYHIPNGVAKDLGDGDEWPEIFEKVKERTSF